MKIIGYILFLFFAQITFGQDDYCEVVLNKTFVGQNERFSYQILTNLDCDIIIPDFESVGMQIVGGPVRGSSSYTNIINGKSTRGVEYHLTYYLVATEKGSIVIPPAKVKCKNKEEKSSLTKINVGEAVEEGPKTHFITATASRKSVYVGEPLIVSVKFYTIKRPGDMGPVQTGVANTFYREDLFKDKQNYDIDEEILDGQHYYFIEVYREILIPLEEGLAEIQPYYSSLRIGNDFFNVQWIDGVSNNIEINVKDLPSTKPDNFNGLVGDFTMSHSINKTELSVGELIDLEIKIDGQGNLNAFDDPSLNFPDEFHVFDPEVERNFNTDENGLGGSISYHYIVSPDKKGDYVIPPFSFSYFNLKEKKFKSLTTLEFDIKVKEGVQTVVYENRNPEDPTIDDINYIHTENDGFFKASDFIFGKVIYWIFIFVPLITSGILIIIGLKKRNRSDKKIIESQQKTVQKSVVKEFSVAHGLIQNGDEKEAISAVKNAMENYFMVKLSISRSELSKQNIKSKLKEKGLDDKLLNQFEQNWGQIEMTQYAPLSDQGIKSLISDSEELIKNLNTQL